VLREESYAQLNQRYSILAGVLRGETRLTPHSDWRKTITDIESFLRAAPPHPLSLFSPTVSNVPCPNLNPPHLSSITDLPTSLPSEKRTRDLSQASQKRKVMIRL